MGCEPRSHDRTPAVAPAPPSVERGTGSWSSRTAGGHVGSVETRRAPTAAEHRVLGGAVIHPFSPRPLSSPPRRASRGDHGTPSQRAAPDRNHGRGGALLTAITRCADPAPLNPAGARPAERLPDAAGGGRAGAGRSSWSRQPDWTSTTSAGTALRRGGPRPSSRPGERLRPRARHAASREPRTAPTADAEHPGQDSTPRALRPGPGQQLPLPPYRGGAPARGRPRPTATGGLPEQDRRLPPARRVAPGSADDAHRWTPPAGATGTAAPGDRAARAGGGDAVRGADRPGPPAVPGEPNGTAAPGSSARADRSTLSANARSTGPYRHLIISERPAISAPGRPLAIIAVEPAPCRTGRAVCAADEIEAAGAPGEGVPGIALSGADATQLSVRCMSRAMRSRSSTEPNSTTIRPLR
jgi:hypothetical protein